MKYTFNELCRDFTGCYADDIPLPEKKADWQYVARQLISGGAVLDGHPDWVINLSEVIQTLDYTYEDFQEKHGEHQTLSYLLYYLTSYEDWEEVLTDECSKVKRQQMNSLYQRFAKACLKCYIVQENEIGHISKMVSPTAWLKEHNLETFEQFCFRFAPTEGCQIED